MREGHAIDVDVPPHGVWYEADEGQIKQIVWNLATNGLRAMPNGGRLRLVAPARRRRRRRAHRAGRGHRHSAREIEALFQPFHGSFAKGSGLGLAIVHRIVTDYNGEIRGQLAAGRRARRVSVHLPARAAVTT